MVRNAPQPALVSGPGHFTETLDLASNQRGSKRRAATEAAGVKRLRPSLISTTPLSVTNVSPSETIYQRCLIVKGECHSFENAGEDYISIQVKDVLNNKHGPQHWPVAGGLWRAPVMLEPGLNEITIQHHHAGGVSGRVVLQLTYIALAQTPPVHLAVLVAKDSPLLIDCPPSKYGAISSAHSSLDAAIAKFRMAAYMWQAAVADDSYQQGLGRRSFRLEEEWAVDTVRRPASSLEQNPKMASVARVHVVRSEKTVAQLRTRGRGDQAEVVHTSLVDALKAYGSPFLGSARPVVAGMILDGHIDSFNDHSISCHSDRTPLQHTDLRLAAFSANSVFSWPRFMDELTSCLFDTTLADIQSHGEICQISQRGILDSVLRALGVSENVSLASDEVFWPSQFVTNGPVEDRPVEDSQRLLQRALQLRQTPQCRLPSDIHRPLHSDLVNAKLDIRFEEMVESDMDESDSDSDSNSTNQYQLTLRCEAALAQVSVQYNPSQILQTVNIYHDYLDSIREYSFLILGSSLLSSSGPLLAKVLTGSGVLHTLNLTAHLYSNTHLLIINSRLRLHKLSSHPSQDTTISASNSHDEPDNQDTTPWALLLAHRNPTTGDIARATNIDLRVGCTFDGIVVRYADATSADNRPTEPEPHHFGGHASEALDLPPGSRIAKVEVSTPYPNECDGIRITLASGQRWGELNMRKGDKKAVLKPPEGQTVVGFFGRSGKGCGYVSEFGILTAAVGAVEELPEAVWGMREFVQEEGKGCEGDCEVDEEDSEGTQC